jgi:hypothetical protein
MTRVARTLGLLGVVMGLPFMVSLARGPVVLAQEEQPVERPKSAAPDASRDRDDVRKREDGAATRDRRRGASPAPAPEAVERSTAQDDEARREALWRSPTDGVRVHIGGNVFVGENERVGKVVTVFGRAEVNGIVDHEVVAIGGDVVIGPKAMIRGDVFSVGGTVRTARGAYIGGNTGQVKFSPHDFKVMLPDDGQMTVNFRPDWPRVSRIAFVTDLMRNLFWFIVCALLIAVSPRAVGRARERAGASPITAFAVGLLAEVLIVPVVVVLAVVLSISVIGIPLLALLPVLMLAFALAMAVGFTGVASGLGSRLVGRATPVGGLVLGLALIWGIGTTGHWLWAMKGGALGVGVVMMAVGFFIEYLACTLGVGAALLAWSSNRRRHQAPAPTAEPISAGDPVPQQF